MPLIHSYRGITRLATLEPEPPDAVVSLDHDGAAAAAGARGAAVATLCRGDGEEENLVNVRGEPGKVPPTTAPGS